MISSRERPVFYGENGGSDNLMSSRLVEAALSGEAGLLILSGLLESEGEAPRRAAKKTAAQSFISAIQSLAGAIDARDPYTTGHSRRVTRYAMMLGSRLSMPAKQLEYLEYMAILHDVGKVGIPDAILHKSAALTEDEFFLMRQHVQIGAAMIEETKPLLPLLPGILYHHERYDGRGLFGKKEEDIPLEARVIAVADAYDAMTSDRPYRQALSAQDAAYELWRNRGTQFDPALVRLFLETLGEFSLRLGTA